MPCDSSYWADVDRDIATTPYGHRTAVACHNCYAPTLAGTLTALHDAQQDGADLLELDLTDEGGAIVVEHDDGGGADGPLLASVLADPAIRAGDQLLNIELKEGAPTEAFVKGVLDAVIAADCVHAGRPLLLRAFAIDERVENLLIAQQLLATPAYAAIAPHVRLHALLNAAAGSTTASLVDHIDENAARGFAAIELEVGTPGLLTGIHHAEALGLGTSVWTVPPELGDMHVAGLRDEVDSITTEYPVAAARAQIEAANGRLYLDATAQDVAAGTLAWLGSAATETHTAELDVDARPLARTGDAGDSLEGGFLGFVAGEGRSLPFADVSTDAGTGVLLAVLVRFDTLALPDGTTMSVLGKANAGEYALELFEPAGVGGTVLRFGVHVGDGYHYASLAAGQLGADRAVWVVGAYDGDGGVHLLVDHDLHAVSPETISGGITPNDAVLQLGADPQDPDPPRFFFDGEIQTAIVQAWP
jgi:glycerophosphoryl diester phosphodiesterase